METSEYINFVEKFKKPHIKTTDDCYTLPAVYEAVMGWACEEYGIDPAKIVRPFYPGGDYEHYDYPEGAVVVDNPPFSIFAKICEFYIEQDIPFFLFAPGLTSLSLRKTATKMCHIIVDAKIIYANGAKVNTCFVTNLEREIQIRTAPKLYRRITEAQKNTQKQELPHYDYPPNVLTAAMLSSWSKRGVEFHVGKAECMQIYALDSQKSEGKEIYGRGLLLSSEAAERKIKAQQEAEAKNGRISWELSEREREIVRKLDRERKQERRNEILHGGGAGAHIRSE